MAFRGIGPVGPAGPVGPQGVQGVQGVQGIQGVIGPEGYPGRPVRTEIATDGPTTVGATSSTTRTITWDNAFDDATYVPVVTIEADGDQVTHRITEVRADEIDVLIANGAIGSRDVTIHAVATDASPSGAAYLTADEVSATYRQKGDVEVSVLDHGAVGGSDTIADMALSLAEVRTASGQAWLEDTHAADLAAFYMAQKAVEDSGGGGRVVFPDGLEYEFNAVGYVHSHIEVELRGGATVTNTVADGGDFVGANRCFAFGIFAREDIPRFTAEGYDQTADNITRGDKVITSVSGTVPAVGDLIYIRSTAGDVSDPTRPLPDRSTFNRVIAVAGDDITLEYPVEFDITTPLIVNYSAITDLKSDLAAGGPPHVYYVAHKAAIHGTVKGTATAALDAGAMLDCAWDVTTVSPKGQAVYGNGFSRSRCKVRGVFGGPRSAIEMGIGSSLSKVDVDLEFSGDADDYTTAVVTSYPDVLLGEGSFRCRVTGAVDAVGRGGQHGFSLTSGAELCLIDADLSTDTPNSAIRFGVATGCRVTSRRVDIEDATAAYYASWAAAGGGGCWVEGTQFSGDQSSIHSFRFEGSDLGGARDCLAPYGLVLFDAATSGNKVLGGYVAEGVASGALDTNQVEVMTAVGRQTTRAQQLVSVTSTTGRSAREMHGHVFHNSAASAQYRMTLAAAKVGMVVTCIASHATHDLRVDAASGEAILPAAAGDVLDIGAGGSLARLRCLTDGQWTIEALRGTTVFDTYGAVT